MRLSTPPCGSCQSADTWRWIWPVTACRRIVPPGSSTLLRRTWWTSEGSSIVSESKRLHNILKPQIQIKPRFALRVRRNIELNLRKRHYCDYILILPPGFSASVAQLNRSRAEVCRLQTSILWCDPESGCNVWRDSHSSEVEPLLHHCPQYGWVQLRSSVGTFKMWIVLYLQYKHTLRGFFQVVTLLER